MQGAALFVPAPVAPEGRSARLWPYGTPELGSELSCYRHVLLKHVSEWLKVHFAELASVASLANLALYVSSRRRAGQQRMGDVTPREGRIVQYLECCSKQVLPEAQPAWPLSITRIHDAHRVPAQYVALAYR